MRSKPWGEDGTFEEHGFGSAWRSLPQKCPSSAARGRNAQAMCLASSERLALELRSFLFRGRRILFAAAVLLPFYWPQHLQVALVDAKSSLQACEILDKGRRVRSK
ncbi:unnamed protein product [Polarella glacialis]|uniref:Uncharacterized protein n=1 Tax=Polarella glacialis TaxID=89957 RepID=A0A813DY93_POLGL|nr:unnamed protein product [Polarella glacialis]